MNTTPLKKAKETRIKSYIYSHECPYCGDQSYDYTESECGADPIECICGEQYILEKGW